MAYHGFFVLLWSDWGNPFRNILEKEEALCLSRIWKPEKLSNSVWEKA